MPMKRVLLPILLFTFTSLKAQQFGGNPPSIKWRQVNIPAARIIFPTGLDSSATEVADIIHRMNNAIKPTIGFKQKKINIVLQDQTIISNAYVGLAPFRSEFYLTPEQNSFELGSLPWPDQLAIHEFRHVQQYNNFDVGISHLLRVLFGEGGQALGNDLAVPNWFFEGDAVFNETLVSNQGRGRLPLFLTGYRALWMADKQYSWMKLRNGSYADYIPNHYPLGYMLVAYGRERYGNMFWKNVTHDAAAYKGGFYPFQTAIKKYAGISYKDFRNDALKYFKQQFALDSSLIQENSSNKHFTADREFPAYVNDSTLVYLKSTYDHVPEFVIKTAGKERKLAVQDITIDNYFSYHNGKIVYAAYRPDIRWGYRNYNELVVIDIKTGQEKRITRKTKYFSPSFSDDSKSIVAVQLSPTGKCELHVLNTIDGELIKAIPNKQQLFFTCPKFYKGGKIVSAVRNKKGQMTIATVDAAGKVNYLLPFTYEPIGFLLVDGDAIYFTKTSGKNDRLYVLSVSLNKVFELKNTPKNGSIGFYQPAISTNKLSWVGFTANGYQINEFDRKLLQFVPVDISKDNQLDDLGVSALTTDSSANLLASVERTPLTVKKYSKVHGLFNFHSIIPDINDPNFSIALEGENILNTFQSRLSLNYNRDEEYKRIGYSAIYGALFPYLSAGVDYTLDRKGFYKGNSIYYNETDLHAGFTVPLNLTAGKYITSVSAGSAVYYSQSTFQQAYRNLFADKHYTYVNNSISFNNQTQQAKQQINPRFAQSISINYKTAIAGLNASQFLVSGAFYFPGIGINHSLVISAAHQQKGQNNAIGFSNDFPFSKAYTAQNLDNMNKIGASYHFPIAYPDAGFGNLIYLLRLRGYLYYDYTHATANNFFADGSNFKRNFRSMGAALFFDTKFFNQSSVSFGIRYSYLLDPDYFGGSGRNRIELVLPVSIF
ncbi:TolB family protein [Mucilaginibacter segetis]|uniref:Uncharacterized protein n=1 Tax=Mucilaginibacter segetis TaxID=2793071 RepID=A0A934PTQ4_9SPHI|nr:hypothetical protein [Mucilaginibacter segetis]MBK0378986.1 hypothetical protein [Mucilaginibacter segetis]